MANLNGFNAATVEPPQDFDPIPAGKYLAAITESEMKPTKDGSGQYLRFSFQIIDGPYKGRYVWVRLDLNNPNPTTVQAARQELSAICRAVGVMQPTDSVELHNIPLIITVKLKKREDTGEMTNEVRGYAKREAAASNIATPQARTGSVEGTSGGHIAMLSDEELAAIEARANAATKGPWFLMEDGFSSRPPNNCPTVYATDEELRYIAFFRDFCIAGNPTPNLANAEFTAHARTDIPALLAYVRELRAVVGAYRAAWNRSTNMHKGAIANRQLRALFAAVPETSNG